MQSPAIDRLTPIPPISPTVSVQPITPRTHSNSEHDLHQSLLNNSNKPTSNKLSANKPEAMAAKSDQAIAVLRKLTELPESNTQSLADSADLLDAVIEGEMWSQVKPKNLILSPYFELTRCMTRLYEIIDDPCSDSRLACVVDLRFVLKNMQVDGETSKKFAPRLVQLGLLELCQHISLTTIEGTRTQTDADLLQRRVDALQLQLVLKTTFTLTDMSVEACTRFIEVELHSTLLSILDGDAVNSCKPSTVIGILFNVVQVVAEARELFRENNAVQVMQKFRADEDVCTSSMALVLMAFVINEDENSLLGSDGKSFNFLANELKTAVNNELHRSENLLTVIELVGAMNKLAVNESNHDKVIESGILESYAQLLDTECDVTEQFAVAQGLWTLASHRPDDVLQNEGCVSGLQKLVASSVNEEVQSQAKGALEVLSVRYNLSAAAALDSTLSSAAKLKGHVFISYNNASKTTCFLIRDRLKTAGFKVWIDADAAKESLAEDNIRGLDKASVVLVCMSQKYHESPFCKKEVIYSVENRTPICPIIVEPRYKPHGWLKFHMIDRLRLDFSREELFEDSFKKLVNQLKKIAKAESAQDGGDAQEQQGPPSSSGTTANC